MLVLGETKPRGVEQKSVKLCQSNTEHCVQNDNVAFAAVCVTMALAA